jgi:hypothetical protein
MPLYTVMTQAGFLSAEQRDVIAADALTDRLSFCSRREVARNGLRVWTRFNNQDIKAAIPITS